MGLRSAHKVKSLTWWRGPIAVLFGLPALWSGTFLTTQVLVLGLFAIAEGMSALIGGLLARSGRGLGWPLALRAMATIPIAVLVCVRPSAAGPALLSAIVAWVMFTGTLDILAMLDLCHTSNRRRQLSWAGAVNRQRQMSWDGVVERKRVYANAEQVGLENQTERKLRAGSTVGVGNGLYGSPARHAAQSAGHQLWA